MATYKDRQGTAIQDKTSTGTIEGEVFYDTASDTFKVVGDSGVETLDTD